MEKFPRTIVIFWKANKCKAKQIFTKILCPSHLRKFVNITWAARYTHANRRHNLNRFSLREDEFVYYKIVVYYKMKCWTILPGRGEQFVFLESSSKSYVRMMKQSIASSARDSYQIAKEWILNDVQRINFHFTHIFCFRFYTIFGE